LGCCLEVFIVGNTFTTLFFIVVDDVKDYKNTCNFFKNETITINERFGNSFDIKTPMVILIKQ
jgi:hypothetical protein